MHRTIILTTIAFALTLNFPALAKKKSKAAPKSDDKAEKAKSDSSDDLWFEAPIVAKPAETETPAKKASKKASKKAKKETPRYGLGLGLDHGRSKREAPRVEERAEDMSRKLTQGEIQRVVRQHHRAISFCSRRAAKKGEKASQVLLHFQVDSKGSARDVSITDVKGKTFKRMSTCMSRAARTWKFPADTSGGNIEYPLILNRR